MYSVSLQEHNKELPHRWHVTSDHFVSVSRIQRINNVMDVRQMFNLYSDNFCIQYNTKFFLTAQPRSVPRFMRCGSAWLDWRSGRAFRSSARVLQKNCITDCTQTSVSFSFNPLKTQWLLYVLPHYGTMHSSKTVYMLFSQHTACFMYIIIKLEFRKPTLWNTESL